MQSLEQLSIAKPNHVVEMGGEKSFCIAQSQGYCGAVRVELGCVGNGGKGAALAEKLNHGIEIVVVKGLADPQLARPHDILRLEAARTGHFDGSQFECRCRHVLGAEVLRLGERKGK